MYSPNPRTSKAVSTCSGAIVRFSSLLHTSLDSDDTRFINSTQHSIKRSCASLATRTSGGNISLIILVIVAFGSDASSFDLPTISIGSIFDLQNRVTESKRERKSPGSKDGKSEKTDRDWR
uniref:Uncharacterized protein MANES_01G022100 n=1 Tax=Rhizophora mucronata TaxID=61149 RepID=A0A2P2LKD3_RHIMU